MKTAVVTGASYGIGEAIAKELLDGGWKVYCVSRSAPKLIDGRLTWIKCDLSRSEQIANCLSEIKEASLDVLVSNAGVIEFEAASLVTKASYDKTFAVNVLAPMLIVSALRDKIQKATVVSVSSVADRFPESEVALYSSSKAANTVYFDALADNLKQARVYTLLPDYTDTPMQHSMNDNNPDFDWSTTIKPEDIAVFTTRLINGELSVESGANIIIVTEKLKEDLKNIEKLYGFNTDTNELAALSR